MSRPNSNGKGEWAKHLRKYGKKVANKGNRRRAKQNISA